MNIAQKYNNFQKYTWNARKIYVLIDLYTLYFTSCTCIFYNDHVFCWTPLDHYRLYTWLRGHSESLKCMQRQNSLVICRLYIWLLYFFFVTRSTQPPKKTNGFAATSLVYWIIKCTMVYLAQCQVMCDMHYNNNTFFWPCDNCFFSVG